MTVFLQRASQAYPAQAQPYQISGTLPAGLSQLQVVLTRESWPVGVVGTVTLIWPDGTQSPFTLSGGDLIGRNGSIATTSSVQWNAPAGGFPNGTFTLSFLVQQTVTTALTVQGA